MDYKTKQKDDFYIIETIGSESHICAMQAKDHAISSLRCYRDGLYAKRTGATYELCRVGDYSQ